MNKSDLLILKAFFASTPPDDFYNTPSKIVMLDLLFGLTERALHKNAITLEEIENVEPDVKTENEINTILSNHSENLSYYYLIKLVLEVLKNYAQGQKA